MANKNSKNIIEQYESICNKIVEEFAKKQGFDDWYWIGNLIGGLVDFNGAYVFSFRNIIYDIQTNQEKGFILKWQDDTLEYQNNIDINKSILYIEYCNGLRYDKL